MFKKILFSLGLLLLSSTLYAQSTTNREYTTFASESITVAAASIGFTSATINPVGSAFRARLASFVVECASTTPCPIRVLSTGTAPTTTVGYLLNQGDTVRVYGFDDINNFRAIRTGANSAVIQPQYSR